MGSCHLLRVPSLSVIIKDKEVKIVRIENLKVSRIPPVENFILPIQESQSAETMTALFRVMAQRPDLAQQSMQLLETAMRSGTVSATLKELVAVRVSQVNHCFY